ncbi:MAG TPA: SseB family protein [Jiangellaceae bacterium]|nr:SseB family protein [Jiangellaceae bacterium]
MAEPRMPAERSAETGAADPAVTAALAAYDRGTGRSADVVAALAAGRLLVPVVAVLDDAGGSGGIRTDKASHMATVTTTGRDGRRGLLAFTGVESMQRWDPQARPVPVPTRVAAEAALAEGADAVVVDLAGPVVFAIEAADLRALAGDPG